MPARRLLIINNLLGEKNTAIFDSADVAGNGEVLLKTLTEAKLERFDIAMGRLR